MKLKLLGFVFAVALILAFIDVGLVPILVNRHDESQTDLVCQYRFLDNSSIDYSAFAKAIQGFLTEGRGLPNVSWWFSATPVYSAETTWSGWISLENGTTISSYLSNLNLTIQDIQNIEVTLPPNQFFRVSRTSQVYDYTEITMNFFSTHAVVVENEAWLWASLFFNALIIASTVIFCVQNSKIKESE